MKSEEFATAPRHIVAGKHRDKRCNRSHWSLRAALVAWCLFGMVAADSSLFTFLSTLNPQHSTLNTQHSTILRAQNVQKGMASYYSRSWTGRRTSNGERLHHDSLTCAHRKYPFGTRLKVTNPANGREVVVRVNDRGPFAHKRIIDLSWGAAKALGIIQQGIAMVVVERLPDDIVIPFKPDPIPVEVPELELETHRINAVRPLWQDDADEDEDE